MRNRHSIRMPLYDYSSAGAYFITVCTYQKECLLGEIRNGIMGLSEIGYLATYWWNELPKHFANISIDEAFVVMPNHIHGIIWIHSDVGARSPRPMNDMGRIFWGAETAPLHTAGTLGQTIAYYKYQSTKDINVLRNMPGTRLWQRNYYERIIRSEEELHAVREYIQNNPSKWEEDEENQSH